MKDTFNIKDIVKDNVVNFVSLSASYANYTVEVPEKGLFVFPVPLNDIGTATLRPQEKAMLFMRWIRKAIEDGTFLPLAVLQ